jgi:hypothetical protein
MFLSFRRRSFVMGYLEQTLGFFDAIKKFLPKVSIAQEYHNAPSEQFPTQTDLMTYLIERITPAGWASLDASEGGQEILIQATSDSINTCKEEVDVIAIARQLGLDALADTLVTSHDRTMHHMPQASPLEIAEVAHGVFVHHFGLTPQYRLEGWLES